MKDDIKKECKLLAISNQTKYNEEKRVQLINVNRKWKKIFLKKG